MNRAADDFILSLFDFLDIRSAINFSSTCKKFCKLFVKFCKLNWNIGDHVLSSYQKYFSDDMIKRLKLSNQSCSIIHAPPSAGKTLLCLRTVFTDALTMDRSWIIIVPPKAFETWIGEIKKFYPENLNDDPEKSLVIAPLKRFNKKHAAFKFTSDPPEKLPVKIFLFTNLIYNRYFSNPSGNYVSTKDYIQSIKNYVFDEAHLQQKLFNYRSLFISGEFILLSAEKLERLDLPSDKDFKKYIIRRKVIEDIIPDYIFRNIVFTDRFDKPLSSEEKVAYSSEKITLLIDSIIDIVELQNKEKKFIIFSPGGDFDSNLSHSLKSIEYLSEFQIFWFKLGNQAIKNFENSEKKAILILGHYNSESVNINADIGIILFPDWINPIRYVQLASRILRINNKNESVIFYNITTSGLGITRALIYSSVLSTGIKNSGGKDIEDISEQYSFLIMILKLVKSHKINLDDLFPIDIMLLVYGTEEVYERWQKETHGLPEGIVSSYMNG